MPTRWAYVQTRPGSCQGSDAGGARLQLAPEDRARGRFVGDQAVQQAALQRRPDRRDLGRTDGGADGLAAGGNLQGDAGEPGVGSAVDDAALGIEGPADQLAAGAQPPHLEQLLARDEAVDIDLRRLVTLAQPAEAQNGLGGARPT